MSLQRRRPLERRTRLVRSELARSETVTLARTALKSSGAISPATDEQKAKVADLACIALDTLDAGPCWGPIDPAHVIDRSMAAAAGGDVRAVVPLCRRHHVHYDDGDLDLSPLLEPRWRDEVAWAVEAVGLFTALRRITGKRWVPVDEEASPIPKPPMETPSPPPLEKTVPAPPQTATPPPRERPGREGK